MVSPETASTLSGMSAHVCGQESNAHGSGHSPTRTWSSATLLGECASEATRLLLPSAHVSMASSFFDVIRLCASGRLCIGSFLPLDDKCYSRRNVSTEFRSQKFQGHRETKISTVKSLHFYHVAFVISILHSWDWGCTLVVGSVLSTKSPSSTPRTPTQVNK